MELVDALVGDADVVCTVGAGGKKTTLYTLAERTARSQTGIRSRPVVSATVRIPIFDPHVEQVLVTDEPIEAIESATRWPLGVVPEREANDRYRGYEPAVIDEVAAADVADVVLVKADGARMRQFKAPNEREPQLPACVDTVIPVASVQVVGEALTSDHVHRPDHVAAITGTARGDPLTPRDVAAVLASPQGGRKDVPDSATVIPLLNMVDNASLRDTGQEIARLILEETDREDVPHVVLSQMTAAEPLVAVYD